MPATAAPPFAPDKNHFHHKLMRLGLFHTEAVVTIYGITAILTGAAFVLRFHSEWLIIAIYAGFCGSVIGFFTLAERRELRFHRTGFFDTGIKARLKVIKDKSLLIRACFLPLQYGLPLLFAAAVLVRETVPGSLAAVAAGFAGCAAASSGMQNISINASRLKIALKIMYIIDVSRIKPVYRIILPRQPGTPGGCLLVEKTCAALHSRSIWSNNSAKKASFPAN